MFNIISILISRVEVCQEFQYLMHAFNYRFTKKLCAVFKNVEYSVKASVEGYFETVKLNRKRTWKIGGRHH